MKTKTPAKPKPILSSGNYKIYDGIKYFLVPEGTYVSKSAYGTMKRKLEETIKIWDADWHRVQSINDELTDRNTKLKRQQDILLKRNEEISIENYDLKSSFSQLAEENKNRKSILMEQSDNYDRLLKKYNECFKAKNVETKVAKFNFRWAMISTAAFILSIIYILIH